MRATDCFTGDIGFHDRHRQVTMVLSRNRTGRPSGMRNEDAGTVHLDAVGLLPARAGLSHMSENGAADTVCSPPPRAARLRCECGEGLGVGALSLFPSVPPPLTPPHGHPTPHAAWGPRPGEGNASSLRLASHPMRQPCPFGGGIASRPASMRVAS